MPNIVPKLFMTGCDKNTEWMLPWFLKNYKKHVQMPSSIPLCVMDFGLTEKTKDWLQTQVYAVGNMSNIPNHIKGWFLKPMSMWKSPATSTCWIDTDFEIRGDISSVFDHIVPGKLGMVEDKPWSKRRGEKWHNSGIVAFTGKPKILAEWVNAVDRNPEVGDQEVLHGLLSPLQKEIYIHDLPNKYNFLRIQLLDGESDKQALAIHWTGFKGKDHIRSLMRK